MSRQNDRKVVYSMSWHLGFGYYAFGIYGRVLFGNGSTVLDIAGVVLLLVIYSLLDRCLM